MTSVLDPTKEARKQARKQESLLREQKQKQALAKAEAEGELSEVKARATSTTTGRRSLISGTQKREQLG